MTSHDVVAIVRRGAKIKKVGHAGTLDPLATGVLIVCLGKATRLSDYVMAHTKTYQAEIHLGVETDTYDAEGQIISTNDTPISREQVAAILPRFQGVIDQVPPMYSAIKQGGKKLYELARQGQTVERPARQVTIDALVITHWDFPRFGLHVVCSSGTYIRSLAYDIGRGLGVGAHLSALRRTASGECFRVENAVNLDALRQAFAQHTWHDYILPADAPLTDMPRLDLTAEQSQTVRQGGFVPANDPASGPTRAYDHTGCFIALLERRNSQQWKPLKVFT